MTWSRSFTRERLLRGLVGRLRRVAVEWWPESIGGARIANRSKAFNYCIDIRPGRSHINDGLMELLIPKVREWGRENYLDIGCNTGWLLESIPGGIGVDLCEFCVRACRDKNLPVVYANVWPYLSALEPSI